MRLAVSSPARDVQRDEVGRAEKAVELGKVLRIQFAHHVGQRFAPAVIGDLHPEAVMRAPRGGDADAAETDQAERLAVERRT